MSETARRAFVASMVVLGVVVVLALILVEDRLAVGGEEQMDALDTLDDDIDATGGAPGGSAR